MQVEEYKSKYLQIIKENEAHKKEIESLEQCLTKLKH